MPVEDPRGAPDVTQVVADAKAAHMQQAGSERGWNARQTFSSGLELLNRRTAHQEQRICSLESAVSLLSQELWALKTSSGQHEGPPAPGAAVLFEQEGRSCRQAGSSLAGMDRCTELVGALDAGFIDPRALSKENKAPVRHYTPGKRGALGMSPLGRTAKSPRIAAGVHDSPGAGRRKPQRCLAFGVRCCCKELCWLGREAEFSACRAGWRERRAGHRCGAHACACAAASRACQHLACTAGSRCRHPLLLCACAIAAS